MNYLNIAHSIAQQMERLESGAGLLPSWARQASIERLQRLFFRVQAKCPNPRGCITARLTIGQKVTTSGFPGTVVRLYSDGPIEAARMYEVRLSSGVTCVCGSDIESAPVKLVQPDLLDMGAFQLA